MKYIVITNLDSNFSRSYSFREGLFAAFTPLLGILPTLEKYQLKPIIDPKIKHYSTKEHNYKMFPIYLELNYEPEMIDTLTNEFYNEFKEEFQKKLFIEETDRYVFDFQAFYCKVGGSDIYTKNPSFEHANGLFFKYYKLPTYITDKVNSICNTVINDTTLGLHYRGSDKLSDKTQNPNYLSKEEYISIIENHIIENNIKHIFLATDSTTIIPFFQSLKKKYNIEITNTNCVKFNDNVSPFIQHTHNPIQLGVDCLIDSLLLSKCNYMILTSSNVSAWSKIFNPKLPAFKISYFPFYWFPQHNIPYYTTNNSNISAILNRIQTKHK